MDPETGFVEVCLRHGDAIRPLQCDELEMDDRSLFELFSRNLMVDTPEGPVAISADAWRDEFSGAPLVDRHAN